MPSDTPGTANRVVRVCRLLLAKPFTIIGDDPRVDLLTVAAKLRFDAAWPRRIVRRIEGVRSPYLNLDDLIASKQTGRHSDETDLEVLRGLRKGAKGD